METAGANVTINTNVSLPCWARLVAPRSSTTTTKTSSSVQLLSTVQREEEYMRTVSFHLCSRRLDQSMKESFHNSLVPVFQSSVTTLLEQFNHNHQHELEEEHSLQKPPPSSCEDDVKNKEGNKDNSNHHDEKEDETSRIGDGLPDTKRLKVTTIHTETISTTKTTTSAGESSRCFHRRRRRHDPRILPVLIVHGPSHSLDRKEYWKQCIQSTRVSRPRAAVVSLTGFCSTSGNSSSGSNGIRDHHSVGRLKAWIQEVTRQCLSQEHPRALSSILEQFQKRQSKSQTEAAAAAAASSDQSLLYTWAANTQSFDEILVFLYVETTEKSSSSGNSNENNEHDLEEAAASLYHSHWVPNFLHWAASQRSRHGIPISVFFMGPPVFRKRMTLPASTGGSTGLLFLQNDCILPTTQTILQGVERHLYLSETQSQQKQEQQKDATNDDNDENVFENDFPLLFPSPVLELLGQQFHENHQSAVETVLKLKHCLAHMHVQRGYFLIPSAVMMMNSNSNANKKRLVSAANNTPNIRTDFMRRTRWFLFDSDARSWMLGQQQQQQQTQQQPSRSEVQSWMEDVQDQRALVSVAHRAKQILDTGAGVAATADSAMPSTRRLKNQNQQTTMVNVSIDTKIPFLFRSMSKDGTSKTVYKTANENSSNVTKETLLSIMSLLAKARKQTLPTTTTTTMTESMFHNDDISCPRRHNRLLSEWIILLDNCVYASDAHRCFHSTLERWNRISDIRHCAASREYTNNNDDHDHKVDNVVDVKVENKIQPEHHEVTAPVVLTLPQHRRHVIQGLLSLSDHYSGLQKQELSAHASIDNGEKTQLQKQKERIRMTGLAFCASTLYRIMEDRVSISQEEWFVAFLESYAEITSLVVDGDGSDVDGGGDDRFFGMSRLQKSYTLFCCAITFLKTVGLIREQNHRGGGGDGADTCSVVVSGSGGVSRKIIFVKTVLVWCSGD